MMTLWEFARKVGKVGMVKAVYDLLTVVEVVEKDVKAIKGTKPDDTVKRLDRIEAALKANGLMP